MCCGRGDDWQVAQIAARDLAADVERVTGRKPAVKQATEGLTENAVLVGTLGKSPVIDRLVKDGRLDVKDVQGQWESFVIATVADPLPGVRRGLVIAGSDRRGTAYGVYELSKRIGVSPWYWWADVTPAHREALHVSPERLRVGPPAVKYRGIFINDEMWGIRPWAAKNFAPDEGLGLGPKTYAKIFELLLRLRANYHLARHASEDDPVQLLSAKQGRRRQLRHRHGLEPHRADAAQQHRRRRMGPRRRRRVGLPEESRPHPRVLGQATGRERPL